AAAPRSRPILVLFIAYCVLYSIAFRVGIRQVRLQGEPLFSLLGPLRPVSSQLPNTFYSGTAGNEARYQAPVDPRRKNVILIVVDSLRAGHLPSFGYSRDTTP